MFKGLLSCLFLAFAYDQAMFHAMIRQLHEIIGDRLPVTAIARRRDVVANMLAQVADRDRRSAVRATLPRPERLKIAVCVSGQMRGFREAVPTWTNLRLDDHDAYFFVQTWRDIGLNWRRTLGLNWNNSIFDRSVFSATGRDLLKLKYPRLFAAILDLEADAKSVDSGELKALFNTEQVVIEDDAAPPYLGYSNSWKMYYKIEQAYEMAVASGIDFDLMIRIRPDIQIAASPDLDWHEVRAASDRTQTVFTEFATEFNAKGDSPIVGDKFYAGTPEAMEIACRAFSFGKRATDQGIDLDMPLGYHPHTTLAYSAFYNGVYVGATPNLQMSHLVNASPLPPETAIRLLREDIGTRDLDELDQALIDDWSGQL